MQTAIIYGTLVASDRNRQVGAVKNSEPCCYSAQARTCLYNTSGCTHISKVVEVVRAQVVHELLVVLPLACKW